MGAGGEVDEGEAHERGRFDVCPPDKLCHTIAHGVGLFAMLVDGGGNVSEGAEAWFVQHPRPFLTVLALKVCDIFGPRANTDVLVRKGYNRRQLGERGKEEEEMRKRMDLGQVNAGSGGVGPGALTI